MVSEDFRRDTVYALTGQAVEVMVFRKPSCLHGHSHHAPTLVHVPPPLANQSPNQPRSI